MAAAAARLPSTRAYRPLSRVSRLQGFPRIGGMGPAGSMGVLAEALARISVAHAVPAGMWAVLIAMTAAVADLALILYYRVKKLEIESATGPRKGREEMSVPCWRRPSASARAR